MVAIKCEMNAHHYDSHKVKIKELQISKHFQTNLSAFSQPFLKDTGMGRLCMLEEPVSLSVLIERVKSHLGLSHIRLALGAGKSFGTKIFVLNFLRAENIGKCSACLLLKNDPLLSILKEEIW